MQDAASVLNVPELSKQRPACSCQRFECHPHSSLTCPSEHDLHFLPLSHKARHIGFATKSLWLLYTLLWAESTPIEYYCHSHEMSCRMLQTLVPAAVGGVSVGKRMRGEARRRSRARASTCRSPWLGSALTSACTSCSKGCKMATRSHTATCMPAAVPALCALTPSGSCHRRHQATG